MGEKLFNNQNTYFLIAGKEEPMKGLDNSHWIEVGWTNDPHSLIAASDVFVLPNHETYFDLVFLSMFVIRYIDVNKTVHMKIRKPIIVGSVLIGGMLIGTYYCGNKIIQFVALCITAIYAMLTNVDMLKSGVNLVKSRLGK